MTSPLLDFVSIDLETTGLEPKTDKIIEIGAISYKNGEKEKTFQKLINPGVEISPFIQDLTGISNEELIKSPSINDVLPEFIDFVQDRFLIFHNAYFDISFLKNHFSFCQIYDKNSVLDTLLLARAANPYRESYKLETLINTYGINVDVSHRAAADALSSAILYQHLIKDFIHFSHEAIQELEIISNYKDSPYFIFFQEISLQKESNKTSTSFPPSLHPAHSLKKNNSEDTEPLCLKHFYDKEGLISKNLKNYEERPWQKDLSEHIGKAFDKNTNALIEAGTGTGKSFAYLIPALIFALKKKEKIIVSTKTKSLQDQLFFKDIPFLHEITNQSFNSVLIKGKNNYLCQNKYRQAMDYGRVSAPSYLRAHLLPIVAFKHTTITGDFSEISKADPKNRILKSFSADRLTCHPSSCENKRHCQWFKTRILAKKADIVITNHSLLFADLKNPQSLFNDFSYLIIDEAHHIEKTATSYFGVDYSLGEIYNLLDNFFREKKKRPNMISRAINNTGTHIVKEKNQEINLYDSNDLIKSDAKKLLKQYDELFDLIKSSLPPSQTGKTYSIRKRLTGSGLTNEDINDKIQEINSLSKLLLEKLNTIVDQIQENTDETNQDLELIREIETQIDELNDFINSFIHNKGPNNVHWFEKDPFRNELRLYTWPLELKEYFRDFILNNMKSTIFISATLSINNNFKYYKGKIGFPLENSDDVLEEIIPSGFPLEKQITFLAPLFLPEPSHQSFIKEVAKLFNLIYQKKAYGSLFLFTSYQMLKDFNESITAYSGETLPVLTQKKGITNKQLIKEFKSIKNSILLGTDSFWEGIDIPGEALELLSIVKLPFQVPDEPIIEARLEALQDQNKNPFYHYTIPEAIIKFKQGFGRLIRHHRDKGYIVILDKRICLSRYGKFFAQSVSVPLKPVKTLEEFESYFK